MRYNIAADSFYIMKLCSRLFVLDCRSRPKDDRSRHFDPHFEEVRGGVEPWWIARWKACAEFIESYVASKSRLKLAARAVLSADAGLLVYLLIVKTSIRLVSCFT